MPEKFVNLKAPMEHCRDFPVKTVAATFRPIASYDPSAKPEVLDSAVIATDVALAPDGTIFVLDATRPAVVRLTSQGKRLASWGRKGSGPGELDQPTALAVANNQVFIAQKNGRIAKFTIDGKLIRTTRLDFTPSDIAVTNDGSLYVSSDVFRGRVEGWAGNLPLVQRLDADSLRLLGTVATYNAKTLQSRPFLAANRTEVRLTPGPDGLLAVWTTFDKAVDVYREGKLVARFQGCMPDKVLAAYKRQRSHEGGFQHALRVTGGVAFENSRRVRILEPEYPDSAVLVTFDLPSGKAVGAIAFDIKGKSRHMNFYNIFYPSGHQFLSYGRPQDGQIDLWSVQDRAAH